MKENQSNSESEEGSPRREKILEMRKKSGMNIFSVIKAHLHHDRYSPIV